MNLLPLIDPESIECLNEHDKHNVRSILTKKPAKSAMLQSDCDEQLLISLAFQQPVRLGAIVIKGPKQGSLNTRTLSHSQTMHALNDPHTLSISLSFCFLPVPRSNTSMTWGLR